MVISWLNRKEEFSKLDEFDLGFIRRIAHGYYARNETLQKQLKEEIAFPYSISMLGFVLKKLGFHFKRQQRESIIHERSDLIAWRESFLRRIKEIREKSLNVRQFILMKHILIQGTELKKNGSI